MNQSWWIRGGRIVDPGTGRDELADLLIEDGVIADASTPAGRIVTEVDARGLIVTPGLIDLHVHFRDPGDTEAETIATGSAAAARGGFTTVVTMPNTQPATDSVPLVRRAIEEGERLGLVRVLPAACITRGRLGQAVADLPELARAGAAAFTDDGSTVTNDEVLATAMTTCAGLHRTILDHALDPALAGRGVMREGVSSSRLGLPGIPATAEIKAVERDIRLCGQTGCRTHIQHVSCGETVELIARARREGVPVSGEATPHHITLTDKDVPAENPDFKMNPPLGTDRDRDAIIAGLCDGTIAVLATDHAPHTRAAKSRGFRDAPFGIVGLETAVGLTHTTLVASGRMRLRDWVTRWTSGPAAVLGLPPPSLAPGRPADITVLDLESPWTIRTAAFRSKSHNTPFSGRRVTGSAVYTFCGGVMTWNGRA